MILATAMAVVTLSGCTSHPVTPVSGSPESQESTGAPPSSVTARPSRSGGEQAAPARVRIPSIGVSARVIALPIDRAGRLAAPKAYAVAGWNVAGPEPGETGTAVIAGHVDSHSGPAVFFRLRELRGGDRVYVDRVDGSTVRFSVTRVVRHPKSGVPASVYRPAPGPELRLVTCGGTFDRNRRSYLDNVIVHAVER